MFQSWRKLFEAVLNYVKVFTLPLIKAARDMLRGGKTAARHMADIRAEERDIESKVYKRMSAY